MKNSFLIVAITAFTLVACNNKSEKEHDHDANGNHVEGTHTHEDGSVHEAHKEEVKQEKFTAPQDSTIEKKNEAEHKHDHSDPNHKH